MPRRLLIPLAVALVALLGSACTEAMSPAVRVGDRTLSHRDVVDELREWAENPQVIASPELVAGPAPGSYSSLFVADLVGFRIERELVLAEADRRGIEVDAELIAEARLLFYQGEQNAAAIEPGWSEGYRTRIIEEFAHELALERTLGPDEFLRWQNEAPRGDEVSVSSRFGRWDDEERRVIPPDGPTRPPDDADPFAGF